jgi:hypothetical protein
MLLPPPTSLLPPPSVVKNISIVFRLKRVNVTDVNNARVVGLGSEDEGEVVDVSVDRGGVSSRRCLAFSSGVLKVAVLKNL